MTTEYINSFLDAMQKDGLGAHKPSEIIVTDGRWNNYHLAGDKNKKPKGAYRFTIDADGAVGQYKDRRIDDVRTWTSKSHKPATAEEKAAHKKRMDERRENDRIALEKQYKEAADQAKDVWGSSEKVIDHPYLNKKGIESHGIKINSDGDLIIPRFDFHGKLWSYQAIDKNGDKKFQYGGKCNDTYYPLAHKDDDKSVIVIGTGFATCATVREALGVPVICAFNDGNLESVCALAKKKYPDSKFIIAADNDAFTFKAPRDNAVKEINKEDVKGDDPRWSEWAENGYLANSGIDKSNKAALKIQAAVIWPKFMLDDLKSKPTDFNDYHKLYGLSAVKEEFVKVMDQAKTEVSHPAMESIPLEAYSGEASEIDWMSKIVWKNERTAEYHKDYCLNNAEVILTHKHPIGGCFVLDEFLNKKTVVKPLPWDDAQKFVVRELENNDLIRTQLWLEKQGIRLGKSVVNDVLDTVCSNNPINPAIDYLDSLKWDGVKRLDTWLIDYAGATEQPEEYVKKVGACWVIAAAKRIYKPGTFFHHMLVLEGGQGAFKSTLLRTLATFGKDRPVSYFSDRITFDMIDRTDFAVHADGNIILEFQELSGMGRKDRNKIKQWITQDTDEFRKPYDPLTTKFPRKFVLAGTTNESQYLNDPTGDRRFWPVLVGKINIAELKKNTVQLWAEAAHRAKQGEQHYIDVDDPVYSQMKNEQSVRYSGDVWEEAVSQYIRGKPSIKPDEILDKVLRIDIGKRTTTDKTRVCDILRRCGYQNKSQRDPFSGKVIYGWFKDIKEEKVTELSFD